MFISEYYHQLDDKNRVRIPNKIKADRKNADALFVMKGANRCLYIFEENQLEKKFEALNSLSITETPQTKGLRKFVSSISKIEEDGQGRFIIPPKLREFAEIKKDVVFIGIGSRIEIWSKERWEAYNDDDDDFDGDFNSLSEVGV